MRALKMVCAGDGYAVAQRGKCSVFKMLLVFDVIKKTKPGVIG